MCDVLQLHLPDYKKSIQLNKDCTLGVLKKYLESIIHIPAQKQIIKLKNRAFEEKHNGLKCIDIGLTHDESIIIEGPTFVDDLSEITKFNLVLGTDQTISLAPKYGLLWIKNDCFDHVLNGECHMCKSTGSIMMPMYCQLTPIINSQLINQDILATIDIQSFKKNEKTVKFRKQQYPSVTIDLGAEENTRIMISDIRQNCGLNYVTPTEGQVPDNQAKYGFCIDNPEFGVCQQCTEPIFYPSDSQGVRADDLVMWVWRCSNGCQMHPKCAFDKFTEIGKIECTQCNRGENVFGQLNDLFQLMFAPLQDTEEVLQAFDSTRSTSSEPDEDMPELESDD